jgi:hypothetical protein
MQQLPTRERVQQVQGEQSACLRVCYTCATRWNEERRNTCIRSELSLYIDFPALILHPQHAYTVCTAFPRVRTGSYAGPSSNGTSASAPFSRDDAGHLQVLPAMAVRYVPCILLNKVC